MVDDREKVGVGHGVSSLSMKEFKHAFQTTVVDSHLQRHRHIHAVANNVENTGALCY